MSFKKLKPIVIVLVGDIIQATLNIYGDTTMNKKTQKQIKLLRGTCSKCNRNKSLIVSDQTIEAEGLKDFF